MENLIEAIEEKTLINNNRKDGIIIIESIKELHVNKKALNAKKNETVDFSSIKFKEILRVIKDNKSLLNDYFKFELYASLSKEEMITIIKQVKVPYNSICKVFEHLLTFDTPHDIILSFIVNNEECITEDIRLIILKKSLKLKKNNAIIEEIIKSAIDLNYMMDVITLSGKKGGIDIEDWVKIGKIAVKIDMQKGKGKNRNEWGKLVRNLLTIAVIKKDIEKEKYDEVIKEIEDSDKGMSKCKDEDGNEKIEGWNIELYQKLINKKGVIIETITI